MERASLKYKRFKHISRTALTLLLLITIVFPSLSPVLAEGFEDLSKAKAAQARAVNVNPTFTLQHYKLFDAVDQQPLKKADVENGTALPIINTNPKEGGTFIKSGTTKLNPYNKLMHTGGDLVGNYWKTGDNATSMTSGGLPTNQYNWSPEWQVALREDGSINTVQKVTAMFADETDVHFLNKPAIEYMSKVHSTPDDYNENYTLNEVWVYQPESGLKSGEFFVLEVPLGATVDGLQLHNPDKIQFTNNPDKAPELTDSAYRPTLKVKKVDDLGDAVEVKNSSASPKGIIGKYDDDGYMVLIKQGTIVRMVYGTQQRENAHNKPANFFDYDITDGKIYESAANARAGTNAKPTSDQSKNPNKTYYASTNRKSSPHGINSTNDKKLGLAFGQGNTGTGLGGQVWKDGSKNALPNQFNTYNGSYHDWGSGKQSGLGLTFGLTTGLKADGTPEFAIPAPDLFGDTEVTGKTKFKQDDATEHYSLNFNRSGSTYTLNQVAKNEANTIAVNNLSKFYKTVSKVVTNGTGTDLLGDNGTNKQGFWPMDAASTWGADGHDMKFGVATTPGTYPTSGYSGSTKNQYVGINNSGGEQTRPFPVGDDAYNHNSYFGMSYTTDFILEPGYCAPLHYFFYGDDDMFVYLTDITDAYSYDEDGNESVKDNAAQIIQNALTDSTKTKKISGVGGVHSSAGMYTDLWNFLTPRRYNETPKHYRLSVFFDERGESGSTCYIRYTLPLEPMETAELDFDAQLKVEKKVESTVDDDKNKNYTFHIELKNGETGNLLQNIYKYTIYENGNTIPIRSGVTSSYYEGAKPETGENTPGIFTLKHNQYVLIDGLVRGTQYKVTEVKDSTTDTTTTYAVGTIENGLNNSEFPIAGDVAQGSVDANAAGEGGANTAQNYVQFINAQYPGSLIIEKKLSGDLPAQMPTFTYQVVLKDQNDKALTGSVSYIEYTDKKDSAGNVVMGPDGQPLRETQSISLDLKDGAVTVPIRAGESGYFVNLPAGTKYTITETTVENYVLESITAAAAPEFTQGAAGAPQISGPIVTGSIPNSTDAAKTPSVTLTYTNKPGTPASLTIPVKKTLTGRDFIDGDTFQFNIAAVTPGAPLPEPTSVMLKLRKSADGTITGDTESFGEIKFAAPGTYTYTITEDASSPIEGILYDFQPRTVTVTVTDTDGNLAVTGVSVRIGESETAEDVFVNGAISSDPVPDSLTFKNIYTQAALWKVDLEGNLIETGTAKFKLYCNQKPQTEESAIETITHADITYYRLKTDPELTTEAGKTVLKDLKLGAGYLLKETKAPDGYRALDVPVIFNVNPDGSITVPDTMNGMIIAGSDPNNNNIFTIQVTNAESVILPSSGGHRNVIALTVGLVCIIAAIATWVALHKKQTKI